MSLIVWDDGEIIQIFSFEDFLFRQWRCQIVQAYADAERMKVFSMIHQP